MREMKDSGIEWVGSIPAHWRIHPVYYYFGEGKNKNRLGQENNLLSLSYGKIVRKDINSSDGLLPESFNTYNIVEADDIIIRPTDLQNDKRSLRTGLVHERGIITSAYICLRPIKKIDSRFFNYQLHAYDVIKVFYNMGNGVRQGLNFSEFSRLLVFEPPINEQKKIADYLDFKCAEIDALTSDIQAQIDALEQYKRSVITEAVTKGLSPDTKMKDSGVEWLRSIPAHWAVDNPKYHFVQRKERAKSGMVQLTASQKYGVVTQEEYMKLTGARIVTVQKDFDILKLVCAGDFIIHMRSFQGGLEYSEKTGSISSAYVMLIPQKTILEPRYYKWFFKSDIYIDALSSTTNLVRDGQAMRWANFIQLPILLPPAEEQRAIANYLDVKCAEINAVVATKKEQLSTLEAYKKSLIYEYVSGKKEVPV